MKQQIDMRLQGWLVEGFGSEWFVCTSNLPSGPSQRSPHEQWELTPISESIKKNQVGQLVRCTVADPFEAKW